MNWKINLHASFTKKYISGSSTVAGLKYNYHRYIVGTWIRSGGSDSNLNTGLSGSPNPLMGSNMASANEHPKGLVSGRPSSFTDQYKASPPPHFLDVNNNNSILYSVNASQDKFTRSGNLSLSTAVLLAIPEDGE